MSTNYIVEIWITSDEVPVSLLEFITKQNIRVSFWKMRYETDTEDTSVLKFETTYSTKMKKIMNLVKTEYKETLYQAVVYEVKTQETSEKIVHLIWDNYIPTA